MKYSLHDEDDDCCSNKYSTTTRISYFLVLQLMAALDLCLQPILQCAKFIRSLVA